MCWTAGEQARQLGRGPLPCPAFSHQLFYVKSLQPPTRQKRSRDARIVIIGQPTSAAAAEVVKHLPDFMNGVVDLCMCASSPENSRRWCIRLPMSQENTEGIRPKA
ncbi:MAG: hypothetical protein FRX49_02400 [Trebouxia sp. A1-2]|nr:MAG: hypothetical protein FRX49_02400 [Trebouxia sp. A1-2]